LAPQENAEMKINDQGFTERLPAQTGRTNTVSDSAYGSYSAQAGKQTSSDSLQLSNLASRLQNTSSADASRAARLNQIASAVNSNAFRIDPAQISSAIVSEAVQTPLR
jgi:anti-sigma28 factor (negative regulator of flagellin synthesis)